MVEIPLVALFPAVTNVERNGINVAVEELDIFSTTVVAVDGETAVTIEEIVSLEWVLMFEVSDVP